MFLLFSLENNNNNNIIGFLLKLDSQSHSNKMFAGAAAYKNANLVKSKIVGTVFEQSAVVVQRTVLNERELVKEDALSWQAWDTIRMSPSPQLGHLAYAMRWWAGNQFNAGEEAGLASVPRFLSLPHEL